ncbi:MAG TPA: hypothetical protein VNT81_03495 [Vicinamibacterales bacterium]|nr:hypothetical protein [Vicinamibacterales bacterium]
MQKLVHSPPSQVLGATRRFLPAVAAAFTLASAVAVTTVGASAASGNRATAVRQPPAPERLVFSSERDGNQDIYLANLDGSGLRRLTSHPAPDLIPRCSPDGRHVVFLRGGFTENGEIYRLDLVTGEERRLTDNAVRDSTPQWSADGRRIFFTRRVGQYDRIAVMNADGTGLSDLTSAAWHDTMPGVSPDGRTLVHHTYRYGRETELHLLDVVSGVSSRLTAAAGYDYEASFAGRDRVVFSSNRAGGHYRLYTTSLADGSVSLLADVGVDAWGSRYSSHSHAVAFSAGREGAWRLMTVDVNGGVVRPLIPDGFSNSSPDWCQARQ